VIYLKLLSAPDDLINTTQGSGIGNGLTGLVIGLGVLYLIYLMTKN
jgi:hypothetical protein